MNEIATTDDDVRQLRHALRGILGTEEPDLVPAPDPDWSEGWPRLAEVGLTGFCVREEHGGFGLRVDAATTTATELGAALHGAPFAGLTASAYALSAADHPAADEVLGPLLAGEQICAFGRIERDGRTARVVDGAVDASALVLIDPSSCDLQLFADSTAWTVDSSRYGFDVTRTCGDVAVDIEQRVRLGSNPVAGELYALLLAADAVGCVQRMLDRAVRYAGQRHAFGRAIGGYQAVQHRLADHTVRVRGMTLVLTEAARLLGAGSPDARRMVALAELSVTSGASRILHDLLQLTGAIGFTWEYGLHFFERRVHHDARLAANPRAATRSLAAIEGWNP